MISISYFETDLNWIIFLMMCPFYSFKFMGLFSFLIWICLLAWFVFIYLLYYSCELCMFLLFLKYCSYNWRAIEEGEEENTNYIFSLHLLLFVVGYYWYFCSWSTLIWRADPKCTTYYNAIQSCTIRDWKSFINVS